MDKEFKKSVKELIKRSLGKGADTEKEKEKKRQAEFVNRNAEVQKHSKELIDHAGDCKTIEILEHRDCCGCHACEAICPFQAITMQPDSEGFLFPVVDHERCKQCGLCQKACPALNVQFNNNPEPVCYAVMANDEIRRVSSSGGMFTLVADPILEGGGLVCGAAYDEAFRVHHIMIDSKDDMYRLRGSKYVQSANDTIYRDIKEALKKGRKVLYSGCPCQVAGLYSYLKEKPENLYTVDLICHGVPAPATFEKYIRDTYSNMEVQDIAFRDKRVYGWSTEMNVYFADGSEHHERSNKDPYYRAFLPCLGMRSCCTVCKYTTLPRQADMSIGDFWGIGNYRKDLRDDMGTSLVLVNNKKGEELLEHAKGMIKNMDVMPINTARPRNYTIDHPFKSHPQRKRFFKLMKIYPFEKAVDYALRDHYDVGVIGLWFGINYGSMMTYFALNRVLEDMGLSVLMIDNPLPGNEQRRRRKTHPYHFGRQYYKISGHRDLGQLHTLNQVCDSFIVGSDQLWNYGLSKAYGQAYFLSFADNQHKTISYATSFGKNQYTGPESALLLTRKNLQRMDAISVRDGFSAEICKNVFGVEAEQVLDPVFLCPVSWYEKLIEDSQMEPKQDYYFAYILDPTPEKGMLLKQLAQTTKKKVYVVLDLANGYSEKNLEILALQEAPDVEVLNNVEVREWLNYLKNSEGVITDSFHGVCFSVVFHKKFNGIINARRGAERFTTILGAAGLLDHLYASPEEIIKKGEWFDGIDYEYVERELKPLKQKSRKWLEDALHSPKKIRRFASYPVIDERLAD